MLSTLIWSHKRLLKIVCVAHFLYFARQSKCLNAFIFFGEWRENMPNSKKTPQKYHKRRFVRRIDFFYADSKKNIVTNDITKSLSITNSGDKIIMNNRILIYLFHNEIAYSLKIPSLIFVWNTYNERYCLWYKTKVSEAELHKKYNEPFWFDVSEQKGGKMMFIQHIVDKFAYKEQCDKVFSLIKLSSCHRFAMALKI